jgi:hypothetical protein
MAKKQEAELIPNAVQDWTVFTATDQVSHQLRYKGKVQHRAAQEHGRRRLLQMADLFNANRAVPRKRIQCAADADNPAEYLRRHA